VGGGRTGYITFLPPLTLYSGASVAVFKHHTAPITSVEWHHTDSSVFAASGSDNQVTLWDLAVERDNDTEGKGRHLDVPPQLLFIHMVWMSAEIRILSLPWNLSFRTPLFNTRDTSIHGTQKLVPLKCSPPSLYFITSIEETPLFRGKGHFFFAPKPRFQQPSNKNVTDHKKKKKTLSVH